VESEENHEKPHPPLGLAFLQAMDFPKGNLVMEKGWLASLRATSNHTFGLATHQTELPALSV
jgi:hypothetical protein